MFIFLTRQIERIGKEILPSTGSLPICSKWPQQLRQGQANIRNQELHPSLHTCGEDTIKPSPTAPKKFINDKLDASQLKPVFKLAGPIFAF